MTSEKCMNTSWLIARIALGFIVIWAFFDKAFGLGFSTCRDATTKTVAVMCKSAWFSGGSPTAGFLSHASGPLGSLFQNLAGLGIIDFLFMISVLAIGLALILGAGFRLAGYGGAALMILIYLASFVPSSNPLFDAHIVNLSVFLLLATFYESAGAYGLSKWWRGLSFVKDRKWLW